MPYSDVLCTFASETNLWSMKKLFLSALLVVAVHMAWAETVPFGKGQLTVKYVARNAVRIQYDEGGALPEQLPDWSYVKHDEVARHDIRVEVDKKRQRILVKNKQGRVVFTALQHDMEGEKATLTFRSAKDEYLYGLGQFQDGYTNVRGLSRRLTQVNTQISLPMLLSSKGYGVLWNNYGMTDYNPCAASIQLTKGHAEGATEEVNVTSTEGGKRERRQRNIFEGELKIEKEGDYALLLDVGQKMARRHDLEIDGRKVMDMQNVWLPPTSSAIVHLKTGTHKVTAELTNGDKPTVYYQRVKDETTFQSPVAAKVDYTVFVGSADEVIATYRELTGPCAPMPTWALGYIHCRERFHSSDEILQTANRFKKEHIPVGMLVQDWQYWGKYGWNAMRFDEDYYPDPYLGLISVESVIDYLRKTNAYYLHFMLPTIERHFELLLARSADKAGNLTLMRQYFDSAKRLLTDRIKHDDEVWFPAVLANKGCRIAPDDVEDRVSDLMSMFIIHLKGDYDQQLGYAVVLALAGLRDDLHQNNRIRERILSPLSTANK